MLQVRASCNRIGLSIQCHVLTVHTARSFITQRYCLSADIVFETLDLWNIRPLSAF